MTAKPDIIVMPEDLNAAALHMAATEFASFVEILSRQLCDHDLPGCVSEHLQRAINEAALQFQKELQEDEHGAD